MALERKADDPGGVRERTTWLEERRSTAPGLLAVGTLACPACDAPVSPPRALAPSDPLECPVCRHAGATRAFLSLAPPARPARVQVVVRGGAPYLRSAR